MTLELVDRIPRRPGPQQARLEPLPEGGCGAPSTSAPAPQHAATQNAPLGLGSGDTISRLLVAGQIDEVLASIALGRRQLLSGDISPLYLDRTAATVLGELGGVRRAVYRCGTRVPRGRSGSGGVAVGGHDAVG